LQVNSKDSSQSGPGSRTFYLAAAGYLAIVVTTILLFILTNKTPIQSDPYYEPFDSAGGWNVGEGVNAQGSISNGAYILSIDPNLGGDVFWVTAGKNFSDGIFEVDAKPLEGAIDNGYGLLFRVNESKEDFYVFKVSGDGYIYIGRCEDGCLVEKALINKDWFDSEAVSVGFNVTNHLKVEAIGEKMVFFVNDIEVGEASDGLLKNGDIGLLAETFTPGGLRVAFDNFRVQPHLLNNSASRNEMR